MSVGPIRAGASVRAGGRGDGAGALAGGLSTRLVVLALLLVVVGRSAAPVNANVRGLTNLGMALSLPFSALLLHAGASRLPFLVAAAGYLAMAAMAATVATVARAFRSDATPFAHGVGGARLHPVGGPEA